MGWQNFTGSVAALEQPRVHQPPAANPVPAPFVGPMVSIIIPAHNEEAYLGQTLAGLQDQQAKHALIVHEPIEVGCARTAALERGEPQAAPKRVRMRSGFHRPRQEERIQGRDVLLSSIGRPRPCGGRRRREACRTSATTLPLGAPHEHVFHLVALVAFASYGLALWQNSIWYSRSWLTTLKSNVDALIYALLTAAIFAWLWPNVA